MSSAVNPVTGERVEGLSPQLVDYYRGEGWTIQDEAAPVTFPIVYVDGERVDPPAPPEVEQVGEVPAELNAAGEQATSESLAPGGVFTAGRVFPVGEQGPEPREYPDGTTVQPPGEGISTPPRRR